MRRPGVTTNSLRWCALTAALAACTGGNPPGPDDAGSPSAPQDKVYVAAEMAGTVDVVDPHTLQRVGRINLNTAVMYMPHNVQVAPDGRTVWITAPPMPGHGTAEEQVVVVDPVTDEIVDRVVLGEGLHLAHVVVDDASRYAYVTAYTTGTLYRLDVDTRAVTALAELGAGSGPHGLRMCQGKLYVATMDAGALVVVDPETATTTEVPLEGMAVQTACSPDGRYVFVTLYDTREVVRLTLATGELRRLALPPESRGPIQLHVSPDSQRLYVCDQGVLMDRPSSPLLYEVSVPAMAVTHTITVGQGAHGVTVAPDGRSLYVTNVVDGTLSVVSTDERTVLATIPTGERPNGVSYFAASRAP
ncbi:MAG: YncE family protein [Myxococcota bacterium]